MKFGRTASSFALFTFVFISGMMAGAAVYYYIKGDIDVVDMIICLAIAAGIFFDCLLELDTKREKEAFSITVIDGVLGSEIPEGHFDEELYGKKEDDDDNTHHIEIEWEE